MKKKMILAVLVLVALLVLVLAIRPSLKSNETAPQETTEDLQQETVSGNDEETPADATQEHQDETPLFSDDDEDVEGIDVSDEVIIDIGENEAVGGM